MCLNDFLIFEIKVVILDIFIREDEMMKKEKKRDRTSIVHCIQT